MNNEIVNQNNNDHQYYLGIRFDKNSKFYFFSASSDAFSINDQVIVETIRGIELAYVASKPQPINNYQGSLALKPIIRLATPSDIETFDQNNAMSQEAFKFCQEQINYLQLDMNLLSAEYTLDRNKLIFSFLSDDRVDFRELLKRLAGRFHTRIDLRQIGSRDRAKMVGGIGICGLPLCCATFLNEFDNISINRAKNQLLMLNIPKLSGHCGKLICCLKFEDDVYSEIKKDFPKIGQKLIYEGSTFRVASMNVLTKIIKIENYDAVHFLSLEEINKLERAQDKKAS